MRGQKCQESFRKWYKKSRKLDFLYGKGKALVWRYSEAKGGGITEYCAWYKDETEREVSFRLEAETDAVAIQFARALIAERRSAARRRCAALGFRLRIHRGAFQLLALYNTEAPEKVVYKRLEN